MRLRESKLSIKKVGDSVRMSDKLGGRGRRVRASVKRGQDIRICGTERRTSHEGHRGRLEGCDMRCE